MVDCLPIGEHARAGALRYYARSTLDGEPLGEPVLRRFVEGSLLTLYAARRLIREQAIDVVVLNHAIYVPHGIVAEVARQEGRRVVAWNIGLPEPLVPVQPRGDLPPHPDVRADQ